MSYKEMEIKKRKIGILSFIPSAALTALVFIIALYMSDELSMYVKEGISLSVNVIIPSIFPFLILSDVLIRYIRYDRISPLRSIFEKLFKINGAAISAYIMGLLCGYPIGAKMSLAYYENGIISSDECERLMAFSNNASPAYIICAVGLGLRGSIREGAILYFTTIFSSILCGVIIGIKKHKSEKLTFISEQSFDFFSSVRQAVYTSISTGGFITVFSILFGLIRSFLKYAPLISLISPFLEISNACLYLSDLCIFPTALTFSLTSLAISFSGVCVGAQTVSLIPTSSQIRAAKYFKYKLLQGVISFLLAIPIYFLFI